MTTLIAALLALGFEPAACPDLPDAVPGLVCYQAKHVPLNELRDAVDALASDPVGWTARTAVDGGPVVLADATAAIDGEAVHLAYFPITSVLVTRPR